MLAEMFPGNPEYQSFLVLLLTVLNVNKAVVLVPATKIGLDAVGYEYNAEIAALS
jgi:hypothetical protein